MVRRTWLRSARVVPGPAEPLQAAVAAARQREHWASLRRRWAAVNRRATNAHRIADTPQTKQRPPTRPPEGQGRHCARYDWARPGGGGAPTPVAGGIPRPEPGIGRRLTRGTVTAAVRRRLQPNSLRRLLARRLSVSGEISATVSPSPSSDPPVGMFWLAPRGKGIQPGVALVAIANAEMKSAQVS